MSNRVEVVSLRKEYDALKKKTVRATEIFFEFLKKKNLYVEIFLVDERRMRYINKEFRGKDRSTNVLSFNAVSESEFIEPEAKVLKRYRSVGEVYLSPSYILKNNQNFYQLLIHGLLHLLGYDHTKESDTIEMSKLEQKICEKISL